MSEPSQNSDMLPRPRAAPIAIVALAASAGGIRALKCLLSTLPADFPVAIVVVQHIAPHHPSIIAQILDNHTPLTVRQANHLDRMMPGTVYIAPPDKHLLVSADGTLSLSTTELVHFVRPSADILFESVAVAFPGQAVAVVLTGTGVDG